MKIPHQKDFGIPLLGLGTWQLWKEECEQVVKQALDLGYRHIDTADVYENHAPIGRAITHFPRKEIFLVSKIDIDDLSPENVKKAVPRFLEELATDYLDLLLIHWPKPGANLKDTLQAMLEFQIQGSVKNIGVSNFTRQHLNEIGPYHFPVMTNQIELHPYLQRRELRKACEAFGLGITAYRPLAMGAFKDEPVLKKIGKKYSKTASQIALRWLIEQNIAVIPKASSLKHLKENLAIFDFSLSKEDMQQIDALDRGKRFCTPDRLPLFED